MGRVSGSLNSTEVPAQMLPSFRSLSLLLAVLVGVGPSGAESTGPVATTGEATALGLTGASVNGTVHPQGAPTRYYFEYGTGTSYGSRTEVRSLPPRLAAYYRESWERGLGGWQTWLKATHSTSGGPAGGYINLAEPSNNDPNHNDGIGTLHLVKFLYPGPMNPDTMFLAAGDPDLRDARVTIWARGRDWRPNGTEMVWWTQSQSNPELGNRPGWRRANWAYTGFSLNDALADGKWHKVSYRLLNDTTQWTYGGNNPTGQGASAARYAYWPIDRAQEHLNGDFFHLAAYVDVEKPPTGSIDFDEFELVYRNESLVFPSNGGRLVKAPDSPGEDAARLTDGWRNGQGRVWRSDADPKSPLELVYGFARPVTIEAVEVHQNPEWPAKDVDVMVSGDGASYRPVASLVLPERGEKGDNFLLAVKTGLAAPARFMKVVIRSGYRRDRWGLGEIEAFGSGATMLPENEPNHVNADLTELRPGTPYQYRLVATSDRGASRGADRVFTTPADDRPLADTGPAARVTATSARLEARVNAMGRKTRFHFEYGPDASYGSKSAEGYAGLQITPRSSYAALTGLEPGRTYHYRVVASNDSGTVRGADRTFRTPARR
jgi:hypothetical protein